MSKKLKYLFFICIALSALLGFVFPNKHPHFFWEKLPIFDVIFGFAGCIVLALGAKAVGHSWLHKNEDYYD